MNTLPVFFLSHGSPMHAINAGEAGAVWQAMAAALPEPPRAVLMASAHWETNLPMLSGSATPDMIYDFGGFPEELYRIRYPAPGAPAVAQRALGLLKDAGITAAIDGCRGFDHGAWVPLRKLFPEAKVPVLQLSIQPALGTRHHFDLGRALRPLRDEGVLIVASGHLTHNLRDWMSGARAAAQGATAIAPYALEFQAWIHDRLQAADHEALFDYRQLAPHATRAHPSEEHFLPLFIALGAAGDPPRVERVFAGFEGSALAMDAYRFN
jgi:4,5-DOPA dioxygenase extradiol